MQTQQQASRSGILPSSNPGTTAAILLKIAESSVDQVLGSHVKIEENEIIIGESAQILGRDGEIVRDAEILVHRDDIFVLFPLVDAALMNLEINLLYLSQIAVLNLLKIIL